MSERVMVGRWERWADGCPACGIEMDPDAEPGKEARPFALECPECCAEGCSVCFPCGRGVPCPDCE